MQLEGDPMGGSIFSTQANIFLSQHEMNRINNCPPEFKLLFYRRYVDDTFVLFNNTIQIQPFLQYVNNQYSHMEFTESKRNNSIPFLDVNVVKHNDRFTIKIVWKACVYGSCL